MSSSDTRIVRIEVPKSQLSSPLAGAAFVAPTAISSFQCFGIHVSGAGIAPDPRMQCEGEGIGRLGGLVSAVNGGVLEIAVPAGPGRRVQLFAVQSTSGICPSMEELLDNKGQDIGVLYGLGEPFWVGETSVDIFEDTTITMTASFDPLNPKHMFQSCGGGGVVVPIASAVKGELPYPTSSPTPVFSPFASTGNVTLQNAVSLTSAEIGAMATMEFGNSFLPAWDNLNAVLHSVAGTTGFNGSRAAFQLKWDVTDYDFAQFPVMDLQLQVGAGSTCAGWYDGVEAAVLADNNTWIPLPGPTSFATHTELSWRSLYHSTDQALSPKPFVTEANGRKYVKVNVESRMAVPGFVGCSSTAVIAGAQLRLKSQLSPLELRVDNAIFVPGTTITRSGAGSGWVSIHVHGGRPPYSATQIPATPALVSVINSGPQDFSLSWISGSGSTTIRITDADGFWIDIPLTLTP